MPPKKPRTAAATAAATAARHAKKRAAENEEENDIVPMDLDVAEAERTSRPSRSTSRPTRYFPEASPAQIEARRKNLSKTVGRPKKIDKRSNNLHEYHARRRDPTLLQLTEELFENANDATEATQLLLDDDASSTRDIETVIKECNINDEKLNEAVTEIDKCQQQIAELTKQRKAAIERVKEIMDREKKSNPKMQNRISRRQFSDLL